MVRANRQSGISCTENNRIVVPTIGGKHCLAYTFILIIADNRTDKFLFCIVVPVLCVRIINKGRMNETHGNTIRLQVEVREARSGRGARLGLSLVDAMYNS